ncbi:hypothetical protein RSOLAG22IIIB_10552 [Rhizoctonia solani]|uniref:Uncharacterized protein n=1 Tax=Rhizoctonia solani TaxID=456999 RepID=A0A0K6G3L9_9AGAM|nr:hypothetical protein RSOLAG22IIIB_10552 [Rhizoctonia solani]
MAIVNHAAVQSPASQADIVVIIPPALPENVPPAPVGAQEPENIQAAQGVQGHAQNVGGNHPAIVVHAPVTNQIPSPLGRSLYGWTHGN